jgi:hypothetical protein
MVNKNKNLKTCRLIDLAIPADRHVMQKEEEKKLNTRLYYSVHAFLVPKNAHKYVHVYNVCICWY